MKCANCSVDFSLESYGTKNRNHCPHCLFSLHVDITPGDRKNECKGLMEPIGKVYKPDGEEVIIHKCLKCGFVRKNRVAGDDSYELMDSLKELDAKAYI